jgi:hypothetical protein
MAAVHNINYQQLQMFHNISDDDIKSLAKQMNTVPAEGDAGFSVQAYDAASPTTRKLTPARDAYMVASAGNEQQEPVPVDPASLSKYIDEHAPELQEMGAHLGSWTPRKSDPVTGERINYTDVSVAYPRTRGGLAAAIEAGRANKQLAIAELDQSGQMIRTHEL